MSILKAYCNEDNPPHCADDFLNHVRCGDAMISLLKMIAIGYADNIACFKELKDLKEALIYPVDDLYTLLKEDPKASFFMIHVRRAIESNELKCFQFVKAKGRARNHSG